MKNRTFRLLTVSYDTATGIGLSRHPGARVCAKIHQLDQERLRFVIALHKFAEKTSDGDIVLSDDWFKHLEGLTMDKKTPFPPRDYIDGDDPYKVDFTENMRSADQVAMKGILLGAALGGGIFLGYALIQFFF